MILETWLLPPRNDGLCEGSNEKQEGGDPGSSSSEPYPDQQALATSTCPTMSLVNWWSVDLVHVKYNDCPKPGSTVISST